MTEMYLGGVLCHFFIKTLKPFWFYACVGLWGMQSCPIDSNSLSRTKIRDQYTLGSTNLIGSFLTFDSGFSLLNLIWEIQTIFNTNTFIYTASIAISTLAPILIIGGYPYVW